VTYLFVRTLSQALQAFMPIAVALAVWQQRGDGRAVSATRASLLASIPATCAATWWFQSDSQRALHEAALAALALVVAVLVVRGVLRRFALLAAGTLIVVRQTMEIGSTLLAAALQVRSFGATAAVVAGASLGGAAALLWTLIAPRLHPRDLAAATRAFSVLFIGQLVVYGFHESAEAQLLPWSDVLHPTTEPYGPDGVYGVHFSDLLLIGPIAAAALSRVRACLPAAAAVRWRAALAGRAAVGAVLTASFMFVGMQRNDALPRPAAAPSPVELAAILARPHVLFRDTSAGAGSGRLSVAALDALDSRVRLTTTCERVSFAGGRGLCLHTDRGVFNTHTALVLGRDLKPGPSIKLEGLPSRTRISADGRIGATTVFVLGDDYASDSFSTRTTIVDVSSGDEIGQLEGFSTWRDGARFRAADFNFWGVTFAGDGTTFYASLRTAGRTYLVRGELALRKLTVVRDSVECPSLSPDGRLLAYKKRVGPSPDAWRLHVLDLETNAERVLTSETRYVNDQVEWLDATHVLYGIPRRTTAISDVWVAPVDGSTPARIFLSEAESPAIVR
jgi:hypothetical protein